MASLWDRLEDTRNEAASAWMQAFNSYNASIGNAIGRLKEQPQDIQGRDTEIDMLHAVLERPITPVALLLGQAGVGKTALVEEFAKKLNSGEYDTNCEHKYLLMTLRLGTLSALGSHQLQSALATMFDSLKVFEDTVQRVLGDASIRIVLFIDEVHMLVTIFGPGTKVGGDVMKDVLARSPIRIIAATTRREYDSTIAVDKPLAERFKQIEMSELPKDVVVKIALDWWSKVAPDCDMIEESLISSIIDANAAYRSDSAEPRKTIDLLEDLVSYCRRTGNPPCQQQLEKIFRDRYSINLSFRVDGDEVYGEIERRIKGQPFALHSLRRLLRAMTYQLDTNTNKPIMTALFTGPTGVGKSETCKAIADKLYPGEDVLVNINMPDYKTAEHEAGFRKRLGETLRHTPNSIILLDEFEKAHESVRDSMLAILDEGIVTFEVVNREGSTEVNTASLRNAIVIATTNAGAEVFSTDARFSQRGLKGKDVLDEATEAEVDQLYKALIPNLQANGFKPEMLGRFSRIVPYRGLSSDTFLAITEIELNKLCERFKTMRGIEIVMEEPHQWPRDTYDFVTTDIALYIAFIKVKADDTNAGGARAIKREISSLVYDAIVDAIVDNPKCSKFRLRVSEESSIYKAGSAATEGGVIVDAIYEG